MTHHPSTRRAGADIDVAATALKHVEELRDLFKQLKREGVMTRSRQEIGEVACAIMEEQAARLMLRNGIGLKQTELDLGRETAVRPAPPEDPQRAGEQVR